MRKNQIELFDKQGCEYSILQLIWMHDNSETFRIETGWSGIDLTKQGARELAAHLTTWADSQGE